MTYKKKKIISASNFPHVQGGKIYDTAGLHARVGGWDNTLNRGRLEGEYPVDTQEIETEVQVRLPQVFSRNEDETE